MRVFTLIVGHLLQKIAVLFFLIFLSPPYLLASNDPFPLYPQIENNVVFWQDVYTRYSTTQGILHDDENLSIIYEVIALEPKTNEEYYKINKKKIDESKEKYRGILKTLSINPGVSDPDAKRVAALFGPGSDSAAFEKAASGIRCQVGQKDRFLEGLLRSGAYLDQIKKILNSNGVPEDLAYLPHVESSFDIKAYSKFGAAGIWQFTLSTGQRFLEIGYTLDERRDPIAASHAAALLLKENYEKLISWPLAITAYNHGAAGMERAKTLWGDFPQILQNYRSRSFGFASRNFYAEFLAARNVARAHEAYFGKINFDPPRQTHSMVLEGYANLQDIIDVFGVDINTLSELNPAIRPPVFKGQKHLPKGYRLHLPITVSHDEDHMMAMFPRERYHDEQKPSHFYAVQKGDTAGKIARMHKIPLAELLLANNLGKNATVYVNQNLRIPLPGEHNQITAEQPIIATEAPLEIPRVPQPMLATILPIPFGEQKPHPQEALPTTVVAAIPDEEMVFNSEIISGNLKIEKVWTEKEKIFGLIKVEVEETLGHFADWLGIETRVLRRINGLHYGRFVHVGQALKIPLDRVSKETFEEKRFDYHKRLQEDFFSAYKVEDLKPYEVLKGESIWSLSSEKLNLPIWLIQQFNPNKDLLNLRHSQKLMIPVVEKKS